MHPSITDGFSFNQDEIYYIIIPESLSRLDKFDVLIESLMKIAISICFIFGHLYVGPHKIERITFYVRIFLNYRYINTYSKSKYVQSDVNYISGFRLFEGDL